MKGRFGLLRLVVPALAMSIGFHAGGAVGAWAAGEDEAAAPAGDPGADPARAAIADDPEALVGLLGDPDFAVREWATDRLVLLDEAAVPVLEGALDSEDPEVRWRAGTALARIRGETPEEDADDEPGEEDPNPLGPIIIGPGGQQGLPPGFEDLFRGFPQPGAMQGPEDLEAFQRQMQEWMERLTKDQGVGGGDVRVWRWGGGNILPPGLEEDEMWGSGPPWALGAKAKALGAVLGPVPDVLRAHLSTIEPGTGVVVEDVPSGATAERIGLARHDVILAVDGTPVDDPATLAEILRHSQGRTIRLDLLRGGEPIQVEAAVPHRRAF